MGDQFSIYFISPRVKEMSGDFHFGHMGRVHLGGSEDLTMSRGESQTQSWWGNVKSG